MKNERIEIPSVFPYHNSRTYTIEEISIAIDQLHTLREAVLYIMNPQHCDNSDLPVDNMEEAMKMLRYSFRGTTYCKDWIKEIIGEDKIKNK
jgi:hypothetical protein